jgi:hypothetical protein
VFKFKDLVHIYSSKRALQGEAPAKMYTSIPLLLFTLSLTFQNVYADLNTMCWYKASNVKHSSPGGPCGVVTPNSVSHSPFSSSFFPPLSTPS